MIHIPRRALIDALTLIARGGCENNTGGRRCWQDPERIRGGHYTSGAWCSACIAQDALGRPKLERGVRPQPDETVPGGGGTGTVAPDPESGVPLKTEPAKPPTRWHGWPSDPDRGGGVWTGYCAMHKVKQAPACRHQCPTCRIHDQDLEIQRIAEAEITKLGRPGDQW